MKNIVILILVLIGYVGPCFGNKVSNETNDVKTNNKPAHNENKEVVLVRKKPLGNTTNGNTPSRCPVAYKTVLYTEAALFLQGQFDDSVLTLYSVNGSLLHQINVPQGADEIRIPELSDKPVEVHINDGVNDYYGYINNNI